MSRLSNPLNDVLNGINGIAGSLKGQRINCHGISAKFSIDSYQKKNRYRYQSSKQGAGGTDYVSGLMSYGVTLKVWLKKILWPLKVFLSASYLLQPSEIKVSWWFYCCQIV